MIIPFGGPGWSTARERARFELVFGRGPSALELERLRRCHDGITLRELVRR
jgi:hypothetical protein